MNPGVLYTCLISVLSDTLWREVINNVMFQFYGEDDFVGSGPRKRLDPVTTTAVLFLPALLNPVAQQQILDDIW